MYADDILLEISRLALDIATGAEPPDAPIGKWAIAEISDQPYFIHAVKDPSRAAELVAAWNIELNKQDACKLMEKYGCTTDSIIAINPDYVTEIVNLAKRTNRDIIRAALK